MVQLPSLHVLFGTTFAGLAVTAVAVLVKDWRRAGAAQSAAISKAPIQASKLVELIKGVTECSSDVLEKWTGELDRSQVQAALERAEAEELERAGVSKADAEAATVFYTAEDDDSRDEAVVAAVRRLKKLVGKFYITKEGLLDTMSATFTLQSDYMLSTVRAAVGAGLVRDLQGVQMLLTRPQFNADIQRLAEEAAVNTTGMGVTELNAIGESLKDDPGFMSAMEQVAQAGQQMMQETQQRIGAMFT